MNIGLAPVQLSGVQWVWCSWDVREMTQTGERSSFKIRMR